MDDDQFEGEQAEEEETRFERFLASQRGGELEVLTQVLAETLSGYPLRGKRFEVSIDEAGKVAVKPLP